jgi:hypothetical protein
MVIEMTWEIQWHRKLEKQVQLAFRALVREIEILGPVRGNWKNYSKLSKTKHHCHLKSGRPCYVVCWEVVDSKIEIVEVYYVGTHEKAPY